MYYCQVTLTVEHYANLKIDVSPSDHQTISSNYFFEGILEDKYMHSHLCMYVMGPQKLVKVVI